MVGVGPKLAEGQRGQSLDKILYPVSIFYILYYNTENQHLIDQNDAQIICYKSQNDGCFHRKYSQQLGTAYCRYVDRETSIGNILNSR